MNISREANLFTQKHVRRCKHHSSYTILLVSDCLFDVMKCSKKMVQCVIWSEFRPAHADRKCHRSSKLLSFGHWQLHLNTLWSDTEIMTVGCGSSSMPSQMSVANRKSNNNYMAMWQVIRSRFSACLLPNGQVRTHFKSHLRVFWEYTLGRDVVCIFACIRLTIFISPSMYETNMRAI